MVKIKLRIATFLSVIVLFTHVGYHAITVAQVEQRGSTHIGPQFLTSLTNITVPQGRDIYFTCVVDNLGKFRVAWLKSDTKAILGIHTHMVSLNPRMSVTHNGYNTWKLHISHVQLNDSGSYMCQVNTIPMKSVSGYLNVVVPPDILSNPDSSFDKGDSNEGGTISLLCRATGVPPPNVQWRREDGKDIMVRSETRDGFKTIDGEKLVLNNVHRTDMGSYLCIASNGVPPSVSKRFDVNVNFPPQIKGVNELVGAPLEREVILKCVVEVYPKSLNSWYRQEGNVKLHSSNKHNISEAKINMYTWHTYLTIRYLTKSDFGTYVCLSGNALGRSEANIRLQELRLPPKITSTSTTNSVTSQKPRRKHISNYNKGINEVLRTKENIQINPRKTNDTSYIIPYVETEVFKVEEGTVTRNTNTLDNNFEVFTATPTEKEYNAPKIHPDSASSQRPPRMFSNGASTRLRVCVILNLPFVHSLMTILKLVI